MVLLRRKFQGIQWLDQLLIAGLTVAVGILLVSLLSWQIPIGGQIQLSAGEVAPHDVVAPRQITYESQILTQRARDRAAQSVPDQYDSPSGRVRRQQVSHARDVLEFMTIVRADEYATPALKTDYLLAIPELQLTPELVTQILDASDDEWEQIVEEVPVVLDRIMREEIRDNNLASIQRRVPSLLTSDLGENAAAVTVALVQGLTRPNSLLNETRTVDAREAARNEVPVQTVSLERNESIVRAGDVVTPEHVEALTQIGLVQNEWNWWVTLRSMFFTLALLLIMGSALHRLHPRTLHNVQEYGLLVLMVVVWLLVAKFMLVPHDWLPYLYPLAALGMLVAVLLDLRVSLIVTLGFTLIAYFFAPNNLPLAPYLCLGSVAGAIILGRAERLSVFFWAGAAVVVVNWLTMAAFRAPFTEFTTSRLLQLHVVVFLNGSLSASIAMIGYLIIGNLFGITTSLQLTELSRPTHPLLRQLLLKASGTYHHTIVVSNLAERAAAAINADAFLTRVGAYYHDIGKTVRPYFFAENIVDNNSPHDKLDPVTSAQIIISHVNDGLDLASKYRLPPRIRDFIREHHGRTLVKYFYIQAQREAGADEVIDENDFRYPGPNPRSKETAVLFLADTCEAAVRAVRPSTREELEALVNRLIDERVADGDLNDCNLTFRELQIIKEIFVQVLQGVHHPRIQYPEPAKQPPQSTSKSGGNGSDGPEGDNEDTNVPLPGGVEEEPAGI